MTQLLALHPWLFAAFPVVAIYSRNVDYVSPLALLRMLGVVELVVLVLWLGVWLLVRNFQRASLVVSLLVLVIWSFGPLASALEALEGPGILARYRRVALALDAVVLVAGVFWLLRLRQTQSATRVANAIAGCLVAVSVVSSAWELIRKDGGRARSGQFAQPIEFAPAATVERPDIYYIILDAYGRHDVLRDVYGYDNRAFLAWLQEHGFQVGSRSLAHYPRTILSIPSSLNMEYVHTLLGGPMPEYFDREALVRLGRNSRLVQVLRERFDYRFVAFTSGVEWTECRSADVYLGPEANFSFGEFGNAVFDLTPFPIVLSKLLKISPVVWHRQRILYTLEHLPDVASMPEPTFTFAHLLCPHAPYVFDEHGNDALQPGDPLRFQMFDPKVFRDGSPEEKAAAEAYYKERYRKQVAFITGAIQKTLEELLRRSTIPPVIVLQSDHGPSSVATDEGKRLWENLAILNAVHCPAVEPLWSADMTPVNTFRVILSAVFGAQLPLLNAEHYWYDDRKVALGELIPYRVPSAAAP